MSGLEVGGSVAGLVSLGLEVCKGLVNYFNSWKDYHSDVAEICASTNTLLHVLTLLKNCEAKQQFNAISEDGVIDNVLQACERTIDKLNKILKKCNNKDSRGGYRLDVKGQWSRVKYPFKESTILKLRDLLQEQKLNLILLLKALQIDASFESVVQSKKFHQELGQISLGLADVQDMIKTSKNSQDYHRILDWLCVYDTTLNHQDANEKRYPGTGSWFFERSEFHAWKESGGLLWVNGEIGRGKSVLCSTVIEHMKSYCATRPENFLLYFYFSFADQKTQSASTCISSLLRQLCVDSTIFMDVEKLYYETNQGSTLSTPRFDDITACIASAIARIEATSQVYIILDALDELPDDLDGQERGKMLKWIINVSAKRNVHLLFTSRNHYSCLDISMAIRSHSKQFKLNEITIDANSNCDDIHTYLRSQFRENNTLNNLLTICPPDILEILQVRANGMFQWIDCQIRELKTFQVARPKDIDLVLGSIPPTLNEFYMRILEGVNPRFDTEITRALQWLSVSLQTLSLEEINEACIIDTNEHTIKSGDRLPGDGIAFCLSGLVRKQQGEKREKLILSHFSVKEFLTTAVIQQSKYSKYGFQESSAHSFLARCCISYIFYYSSSPAKLGSRKDLKTFPLLYYACRFWFEHFKLAKDGQEVLTPLVLQFLDSTRAWDDSLWIYNHQHPVIPFTYRAGCKVVSLLGWVAILGLETIARELLKNGGEDIIDCDQDRPNSWDVETHFDIGGYYAQDHDYSDNNIVAPLVLLDYSTGTALMKAIYFNHENIAQLLVEKGAKLDINVGRKRTTALGLACKMGRENLVELLLNSGADPNCTVSDKVALTIASRGGHLNIVKLLLRHKAYADGVPGFPSPLKGAAEFGDTNTCRLLLEAGADVNGTDSHSSSPLMEAASRGHLGTCELLVDRGANINLCVLGEESRSYALTSAAEVGNVNVVKFLLKKGIHIHHEALYAALSGSEDGLNEEHEQICGLLIHHGANLNPYMNGEYDQPLTIAIYNGWENIAGLMLRKGARVDPGDPSCLTSGNILQAAVISGSVEMVDRLLNMNINVNASGRNVCAWGYSNLEEYFASPLQAAAYELDIKMVKFLLEKKADVNDSVNDALYVRIQEADGDTDTYEKAKAIETALA